MSNTLREIPEHIRSVYNATGSGTAIAKGKIVKLKTSPTVTESVVVAAADTDKLYGVTRASIADAQYGEIVLRGRAQVLAGSGGLAVGDDVKSGNAGQGLTASSGDNSVGYVITAAAENEYAEVELTGCHLLP